LRQELEHNLRLADSTKLLAAESNQLPQQSSRNNWTPQQEQVYNVLLECRPASVLDVASGKGWLSPMATLVSNQVVAFDPDSVRVSHLYRQTRAKRLPILPLVMDVADPTPARGLFGHWAVAATDRLQCEMVVALGLVQHMVFDKHLDFDHIVGGLAQFSKKWVLVEFDSPEDLEFSPIPAMHSWYCLDNFVEALRRWFATVTVRPSYSTSRVLLLCGK
jgi:hypothetical protein